MKDMMTYKSYYGSVHYSDEDLVFHGKLEFMRSLVGYEGTEVTGLRQAFHEAVDDYLELCESQGISPETPFSESLTATTGVELHRRAALFAKERGIPLDRVVTEALEQYMTA